MGTLLEMIQARIAELKRQTAAFSGALTDEEFLAGIEELVRTAMIGGLVQPAPMGDYVPAKDYLAQLTADTPQLQFLVDSVWQHLAAERGGGPEMLGMMRARCEAAACEASPPVSDPGPAAPSVPPVAEQASEVPTGVQPTDMLPGTPAVVVRRDDDPPPYPMFPQPPGPAPTIPELQALWPRGREPSGVQRTVTLYGWQGVLRSLRPGETAAEFKQRAKAGHATAPVAEHWAALAKRPDDPPNRGAGWMRRSAR